MEKLYIVILIFFGILILLKLVEFISIDSKPSFKNKKIARKRYPINFKSDWENKDNKPYWENPPYTGNFLADSMILPPSFNIGNPMKKSDDD